MVGAGELRGRRQTLPQLLYAGPHVPQPGLDQAVRVQEQGRAGRGVQLHGLEVHAAHADRGAGRDPQHLGVAAQVQQDGRRVAGVGDGDAVRDRVVDRVQAGGHAVGAQALGLLVQVVQHLLRRQVEPGQVLRRGPQLAHDGRRRHGVAHHVADDQRDPAARQRDGVVPVAAHPGGLGGRQVAGGQAYAGAARQVLREHRALQLVGDVRLPPVQHRFVDAQGAVRGELGGHQEVVGLEGDALRAAQEQRGTDHPAPPAQRREDRPAPVGQGQVLLLAQQFGQRRAGRPGVREDRAHPAQHLGERAARPHLAQFGAERLQLRGFRLDRRREAALGVPLGRYAVGAPQPQHQGTGGALVADRQGLAQIDEDGVRERRHGGPAQPHHDLVQVHAPGDPPGRGAHEPQPVPVPTHRRGLPGRGELSGAPVRLRPAPGRGTVLPPAVRHRVARDHAARGDVARGHAFGGHVAGGGAGRRHGVRTHVGRLRGARLPAVGLGRDALGNGARTVCVGLGGLLGARLRVLEGPRGVRAGRRLTAAPLDR